jgi:hypothetical protein
VALVGRVEAESYRRGVDGPGLRLGVVWKRYQQEQVLRLEKELARGPAREKKG